MNKTIVLSRRFNRSSVSSSFPTCASTKLMLAKYARMKGGAAAAFLDPDGYKKYVADKEQAFRNELAKQKGSR